MSRLFIILAINLASFAAFASGAFQGAPAPTKLATTSASTYYVRTGGSDGNACTSAAAPCLTVNGALSKIPRDIYHAVDVDLGQGTFGGFTVEGFTVHPVPGRTTYLSIHGTLINATPATGTSSGTLSSATAVSGATFGTLTDSTQTWTTSDLVGKLVGITGGTGNSSTSTYVITANTATTLTVAGLGTTPNNTSTYQIYDWGTTINTPTGTATGLDGLTSVQAACVRFDNNNIKTNPNPGDLLGLTKVKLACTSGSNQVDVEGPSDGVTLRWDWLNTPSGTPSGNVLVQTGANLRFFNNYSVQSTAVSTIHITTWSTTSYAGGISISASYFFQGQRGMIATPLNAVVGTSYFFGQNGSSIDGTGIGSVGMQVFANRMDCNGTTSSAIRGGFSTAGGNGAFTFGMSSGDISNCLIGVELRGSAQTANISLLSGTGNTTALSAKWGAHMQVSSDVTVTGTTELAVDGATSTLTSMRGLTPKVFKDSNYFSAIYE
jgi:hypothetical protein